MSDVFAFLKRHDAKVSKPGTRPLSTTYETKEGTKHQTYWLQPEEWAVVSEWMACEGARRVAEKNKGES